MFFEAFVNAQRRSDIHNYGLVGFLRDDGTAACKKLRFAVNKLSLYKCVMINVERTRGVNYIEGLTKVQNPHREMLCVHSCSFSKGNDKVVSF